MSKLNIYFNANSLALLLTYVTFVRRISMSVRAIIVSTEDLAETKSTCTTVFVHRDTMDPDVKLVYFADDSLNKFIKKLLTF